MPRIRKSFASIQARLLVVFLVIMLLAVVVVVVFNQRVRAQLMVEADNALLISATQIAERIDEFNRSNQQSFSMGTRLPALVDFLQATEEERGEHEFWQRAEITLDSLDIVPWDEYYVLSQAILDRNGLNILDTASYNIGTDESQHEYFRAALLGGTITISPLQYRPELSGIYFYYAMPLRQTNPPNVVIGVLRVQISIASIQNIVFESALGQDLNVAVFDENFVRVVDTQNEGLLFRSIVEFSDEEIATLRSQYALPPLPDDQVSVPVPALVDVLSNTHQKYITTGYLTSDATQEERIVIIRPDTVPWYLVVSRPTAQHYRAVKQQTTSILVLVASLIVLAFISSYLISNRITKPIRALTAVAEQVTEGNLHIKAPVTSIDEVGTLAKTFNLMTSELEMAQATLEDRVEKRTQQLLEANEKLKYEIVERQRYEKQALELALEQERRRILSEFIQKASHEFRTPLSIINVNSYLVRRMLPGEQRQHINVIEEQAKYIEGLINRMVLMSRLDSGVSTPTKHLPIDDVIRTIYTSKRDTFVANQAQVYLDLQADGISIAADPELMFTAFQNILDNAFVHTEAAVEIFIKTRVEDDVVVITIADNGVGIPEDLQTRVFERFFRVDESHSTRGFGLGLPIAKRIVENFGGTIMLESEVGKGTTITIALDVASETTKEQV